MNSYFPFFLDKTFFFLLWKNERNNIYDNVSEWIRSDEKSIIWLIVISSNIPKLSKSNLIMRFGITWTLSNDILFVVSGSLPAKKPDLLKNSSARLSLSCMGVWYIKLLAVWYPFDRHIICPGSTHLTETGTEVPSPPVPKKIFFSKLVRKLT